ALKEADTALFDQIDADPSLLGMGTTLTLAFSVADTLFLAHAGDSRAYLYRAGQLDQLTSDHTLVQDMVDACLMTPEQARNERRRNIITNVIGGPTSGVSAEIDKIRLEDGDVVLLCTDGLTEVVEDDEIAEVLAEFLDPEDACDALIDLALECGGPDNVTAVV